MLILSRRFYLPVILVCMLGPLIGCSPYTAVGDPGAKDQPDAQPGEPPEPSDEALPDFSVADVNADSARYQQAVSPRDYLGQISAWYFGRST